MICRRRQVKTLAQQLPFICLATPGIQVCTTIHTAWLAHPIKGHLPLGVLQRKKTCMSMARQWKGRGQGGSGGRRGSGSSDGGRGREGTVGAGSGHAARAEGRGRQHNAGKVTEFATRRTNIKFCSPSSPSWPALRLWQVHTSTPCAVQALCSTTQAPIQPSSTFRMQATHTTWHIPGLTCLKPGRSAKVRSQRM